MIAHAPRFIVVAAAVAIAAVSAGKSTLAQTDQTAHGHALFETYCSVCHGKTGEGFIGPKIGGIPWPAAALQQIVRGGVGGYGAMPAFSKDSVSDDDVAAIAAYLSSTAAAPSASSAAPAASSAPAASGAPDAARGAKIFAANCSPGHGAQGQGGVGPSLHNEGSRKNFAAAVAWIENPAPPMPKLYPDPLSLQDVQDVAAFVEKL